MHRESTNEPTPESLAELPELDFSRAIRPNRYANLRGAFAHAVFLDPELWLVDLAKDRAREISNAAPPR